MENVMRHGSLFSGIGGFDLAAEWMEWENIFQVEKDEWCRKVLAKNFPNTKRYGDIKEFEGKDYRGTIDILSGGPPCQPASNAGKRQGEKDIRWLWPEAIRVFGEIKPSIGVFENTDDLLTLDNGEPFERICSSMENFGYKVETYGLPAALVGAWHERDRIWIIAYSDNFYDKGELDTGRTSSETKRSKGGNGEKRKALDWKRVRSESFTEVEIISNTHIQRLQGATCTKLRSISKTDGAFQGSELSRIYAEAGKYWEAEPGMVRMVHGIPNRVDRIKGLGNAIVPQIAFEIFKAIDLIQKQWKM